MKRCLSSSLTLHSFRCAFNFRSGNEIQFPTKIRLSLQNWNWIFIRGRKEKTEDDSSSGSKPEQLDQWHEVKKLYLEEKENRVWTKRLTGFSFSFPSFYSWFSVWKKELRAKKKRLKKQESLVIYWSLDSLSQCHNLLNREKEKREEKRKRSENLLSSHLKIKKKALEVLKRPEDLEEIKTSLSIESQNFLSLHCSWYIFGEK